MLDSRDEARLYNLLFIVFFQLQKMMLNIQIRIVNRLSKVYDLFCLCSNILYRLGNYQQVDVLSIVDILLAIFYFGNAIIQINSFELI